LRILIESFHMCLCYQTVNKHEVIVTLNKLVHVQKSKLNRQLLQMVFDYPILDIKPDSDSSLKDIGLEFLSLRTCIVSTTLDIFGCYFLW